MSIEQRLSANAEAWLEQEVASSERMDNLEALVRQRSRLSRKRWVGVAAAVAAAVTITLMGPTLVSVAADLPWIGPYIARMAAHDEGAHWAEQRGYLAPVIASASDNGYTLRVEGVLADPARTIIYYSVEGPELKDPMMPPTTEVGFDPERSLAHSGRHEVVDGKLIGEITTAPLPGPTGTVYLRGREINGVTGNWSLSFDVSRTDLSGLAREYPVDQHWQGEGYDLRITRLLIAPTQTTVEVEGFVSSGIDLRQAELVVDGQALTAMGTSTGGASTNEGRKKVTYRYSFDRIDAGTASTATFRLTAPVQWQESDLVVDLKPGARVERHDRWFQFSAVGEAEGGTQITLQTGWQPGMSLQDFSGWTVIGARGVEERVIGAGLEPNGDGTATLTLQTGRPVPDPARLEAGSEAVVIPGSFEATISLK